MEKRELICIGCPLGCPITVTLENSRVVKVEGNTCPRGKSYGEKECTDPTRIVTSTVRVEGGVYPVVPVKTSRDIPKEKIQDCIREIKGLRIKAPVKMGEVLLQNAAGTGADILAVKEMKMG